MYKNYVVSFFVIVLAMLFGCAIQKEEVKPSNIDIPDYGVLTYKETLFDDEFIIDILMDTDKAWLLNPEKDKLYQFDLQSKRKKTFDINSHIKRDGYFHLFLQQLFQDDQYIYIFFDEIEKKTGTDSYKEYKIFQIHKPTYEIKVISFPDTLKTDINQFSIYMNVETFYLKTVKGEKCYKSNDRCITWTEITESDYKNNKPTINVDTSTIRILKEYSSIHEEYHGFYKDEKEIVYLIDDKSTTYTNTNLYISLDNGLKWYSGSLGTNYGNSLIRYGDYVYVASHPYYEALGFIPTQKLGGGLLVFKWEYY